MFGLSFSELLVIAMVTLVAVGPQKLPGMLRTLGQWANKLRKMTTEVRAQTGIDEILRAEGIHGGLTELRGLVRGQALQPEPRRHEDPYSNLEVDVTREYPPEGPDARGALSDDLWSEPTEAASEVSTAPDAEIAPSTKAP